MYVFTCLTYPIPSHLFTTTPPPGPHFAEYLHWDVTEECEVRLVCKVRGGLSLSVPPERPAGGLGVGCAVGCGVGRRSDPWAPGTCSFPDFQSCLGSRD